MRPHCTERSNKGFTMMELMGVVAIIAIVMAVAFPAAGSIKRDLNQTQLDQTAKQIYLAAQNRLTATQSSGRLASLEADIDSGQKISTMPVDYTGSNWEKCSLYYVGSSDKATQDYLVTSSGNLYTSSIGNYVIEVSPSTGEIYSVFYWEGDEGLSYSDILSKVGNRSREARLGTGIGYYCGSTLRDSVDRSNKISFKNTQVTIVNDEELYLKLENSAFGTVAQEGDLDKLIFTIKVTGDHGWSPKQATRTLSFSGSASVSGIDATTDEVTIPLDSMREGMSFYDIVDGTYDSTGKLTGHLDTSSSDWIYPGSNVSISVTISYDTDYDFDLGTCSSLYGSFENGTVTASCVRHLNNLRLSKRVSDLNGMNAIKSVVIKPTVGDTIDFDEASWANTSVSIKSRVGGISSGAAYNPLETFAPLVGNEILWGSGGSGTIDGMNTILKNFKVSDGYASAGGTGIFGSIRCVLSNLFVVDPTVTGTQNTGALVGLMDSGQCSVSNCGVYLTGGYDRHTISGTENVGGLIGAMHGNGVTSSFAAINVSGTKNVGGFVGNTSNTISKCYSSGDVSATESCAGGFGGYLGGNATECYTTSDVLCDVQTGAFAGFLSSWSSSDCVAYGCATKQDGTTDDAFVQGTNGFCGTNSALNWKIPSLVFLQMHNYNDKVTSSNFTAMSYESLLANDPVFTTDTSHPYASALVGKPFPFANTAGLGVHWGDWPDAPVTVTYQRDNGVVLERYEMVRGEVPSPSRPIADYEYIDTYGAYHLFSSWSEETDSAGNMTFTASCTALPMANIIVKSNQGNYKINGITCTSLWNYINDKKRNDSNTGLSNVSFAIDSEPPLSSSLANTGYWIKNYLSGLDSVSGSKYNPDAFSFVIDVENNTYARSNIFYSGDTRFGTGSDGTITGRFTVIIGEKLPAYPTSVTTPRVIEYDLGRAMNGLAPYRIGTITRVYDKNFQGLHYWAYDWASFVPDDGADWMYASALAGGRS